MRCLLSTWYYDKQYIITCVIHIGKLASGEDSEMEKCKKNLQQISAVGQFEPDLEKLYDDIISQNSENADIYGTEDFDEDLEDNAKDYLGTIFTKLEIQSKNLPAGCDPNPFHSPDLVLATTKSLKYVVLWSGIMLSIFKYGKVPASSAISESSFNNIQNRYFKPNELPMDTDIFIEKFLKIHEGSLKLSYTEYPDDIAPEADDKQLSFPPRDSSRNLNQDLIQKNALEPDCSLCKEGHLPSALKCTFCQKKIHAISPCSYSSPEVEDDRICFQCYNRESRFLTILILLIIDILWRLTRKILLKIGRKKEVNSKSSRSCLMIDEYYTAHLIPGAIKKLCLYY